MPSPGSEIVLLGEELPEHVVVQEPSNGARPCEEQIVDGLRAEEDKELRPGCDGRGQDMRMVELAECLPWAVPYDLSLSIVMIWC